VCDDRKTSPSAPRRDSASIDFWFRISLDLSHPPRFNTAASSGENPAGPGMSVDGRLTTGCYTRRALMRRLKYRASRDNTGMTMTLSLQHTGLPLLLDPSALAGVPAPLETSLLGACGRSVIDLFSEDTFPCAAKRKPKQPDDEEEEKEKSDDDVVSDEDDEEDDDLEDGEDEDLDEDEDDLDDDDDEDDEDDDEEDDEFDDPDADSDLDDDDDEDEFEDDE
jgi:hypothetical protein